jgi:hypothetical protein
MEARFPSKEKVAGSSPALGIYFEFSKFKIQYFKFLNLQ